MHGKGVQRDYSLAKELFYIAAHKFGHFDSIYNLGVLSYEGDEGDRNIHDALKFLKLSSSMGSYHNWIRRGLDNYLNGLHLKSLMCYVRASHSGFEIASANAAYIIQRKVASNSETIPSILNYVFGLTSSPFGSTPQHFLEILIKIQTGLYAHSARLGNIDSMVSMGHACMDGSGIEPNPSEAILWYSRASVKGQPMGSFYMAMMNHFGLKIPQNIPRAVHYYEIALRDGKLPTTFRLITSLLFQLAEWRMTSTLVRTFAGTFERVISYCARK